MSKNHKKVCATLNYIEQFLILASTFAGCGSITTSASLVGIPLGITRRFVTELKICAITT